MEMTKYQLRIGEEKNVPFIPDKQNLEEDDEEDWEKEAIIKTSYDPRKRASLLPVLRKLEGATPCQRKEFRALEKVRLNALESAGVERMTGLRKPQLEHGGGPGSTVGTRGSTRGRSIGGVAGTLRLITVGRGVSQAGGRQGEVLLGVGRGRGVVVENGRSVGVVGKRGTTGNEGALVQGMNGMADLSVTVDGERTGTADTESRSEISKAGKGRGRVMWGRQF